jgi:hypothetical protein
MNDSIGDDDNSINSNTATIGARKRQTSKLDLVHTSSIVEALNKRYPHDMSVRIPRDAYHIGNDVFYKFMLEENKKAGNVSQFSNMS